MTEKKRLIWLVAIMAVISTTVIGIGQSLLYNTTFNQQQERLVDTVTSHVFLVKAVARHNQNAAPKMRVGNPEYDPYEETLNQLREAHFSFGGIGKTGEITLARFEGDQILFLLNQRHHDSDNPQPVPISSPNAEPMRRALRGQSGTVVGLDYRGQQVLAAYGSIAELGLGIVAKIDLSEIRAPFIRTGLISVGISLLLIIFGGMLFFRIGNPIVRSSEENEEKYRQLFSAESDAILVNDAETSRFIDVNQAAMDLYGYGKEEFLELKITNISAEVEETKASIAETLKGNETKIPLRYHKKKDGTIFPVEISPIKLNFGDSIILCEIVRDLTESKRAEDALRESKRSLAEAQRIALIGSWDWDITGSRLSWSDETFRQMGLNPGEITPTYEAFEKFVHPDDRELVDKAVKKALNGENSYSIEAKMVRVDGTEWIMYARGTVSRDEDGAPVRFIGTQQDITERKRADEALKEAQLLLESSIESPKDMIIISIDKDYRYLFFNNVHKKAMMSVYGKDIEVGMNILDCMLNKEDREKAKINFCRALAGESHSTVQEYGELDRYYYETFYNPIINERNEIVGATAFARNITERKKAEVEILKFKAIADHVNSGAAICDLEGNITYVNEYYASKHDYKREELIGKNTAILHNKEQIPALNACMEELLQTGTFGAKEKWHVKKDGSVFPMLTCATVIKDKDNLPVCIGVTAVDISAQKQMEAELRNAHDGLEVKVAERTEELTKTNELLREENAERKRAEERLRDSEKRSRAWLDNSPTCTKIVDLDFNLQYMSVAGIKGLKIDDINQFYGKPYPFYFYPDSFKIPMTRNLEKVKKTGEVITQEASIVDIEGNELWYHSTLVPVNDDEGRIEYIIIVSVETTERRRAERALQESEKSLSQIYESTGEVLFQIGVEPNQCYRFLSVNSTFLKVTGLRKEQVVNKTIDEVIPEPSLSLVRAKYAEAIREKKIVRWEETSKYSSGVRIGEATISPAFAEDGTCTHLIGSVHDITDRKRAEEALKRSEERFRASVENMLDCFGIYSAVRDDKGQIVDFLIEYVNQAACENNVMSRDEQIGKRLLQLLPAHRESGLFNKYCRVVETGKPLLMDTLEYDDKYKSHQIARAFDIRVAKLGDGFVASWRDITERKRTEKELNENKERFRLAAQSISDLIYERDIVTNRLDWYGDIDKALGFEPGEFSRTLEAWLKQIHPDDQTRLKDSVKLHMESTDPINEEYRIQRKDGSWRYWLDQGMPVLDSNGCPIKWIGACIDITKLKAMEATLRESETIAATGRMAARIAHEINNPLAGIKNSFKLIKSAIPNDHKYFDYVERIDKEIDRVAGIVRQMYEIYRPNQKGVLDFIISDAINDVMSMLESSSRERDVTILFDSQDKNSQSIMPEGPFKQVMYNIIQNAIDASPLKKVVKVDLILSDTTFQITVGDQGDGIPDKYRSLIFEPFFTTKDDMKNGGLGLGLSICKGIIERSNGSLDFICEPNKGTVFRITLPLRKKSEEVEVEK